MAIRTGVIVAATLAFGCASAPSLKTDPQTLASRDICKLRSAALKKGDYEVSARATAEFESRGYSIQDCYHWAAEDEIAKQARAEKIKEGLAVAAVALGVAAAAYFAASQGGGAGQSVAYDFEWDWDLFYDQYGNLVAACRGVQTGQFADAWRCSAKAQTDWRWPGK